MVASILTFRDSLIGPIFDCSNVEDGANRLSRNVDNKLQF